MSNLKRAEDGFTIVELLVSIIVGAIIIASLNQLVSGYLHVSQRGRYLSLANSYAEGKVEALRNTGYNGLSLGTSNVTSEITSQLPKRNGVLQISQPQSGIKQVDLTVSYQDQGSTKSYTYTTYIGELGVGQ